MEKRQISNGKPFPPRLPPCMNVMKNGKIMTYVDIENIHLWHLNNFQYCLFLKSFLWSLE